MSEAKTFDEFADRMMERLFDSLITGGTKSMRSQLYVWLPYYKRWIDEQQKPKVKPKKRLVLKI